MSNKRLILGTAVLFVAVIALASYSTLKPPPNPSETPSQSLAPASTQALPTQQASESPSQQAASSMHTVTLTTNFGNITFETYDSDAPKTVQNFITLAEKGFYSNLTFHRVIKGFMIQGGDPKGNGTGGPGYKFNDELNPNTESGKAGYKKGVVAMANAGPNTNGSQFFIMHEDRPYNLLPYNYTIFGKVTAGQDTVDKIAQTPTDQNDRPLTPVVIKRVTVSKK